jgi:hypothetical protein
MGSKDIPQEMKAIQVVEVSHNSYPSIWH